MVNIKTEFPRGINSDQVISLTLADGCNGSVHPGPGQQLGEVQPCDREATPSSKPQASSDKLQAPSNKRQAPSRKLQAL
jgi:hypothetical protein